MVWDRERIACLITIIIRAGVQIKRREDSIAAENSAGKYSTRKKTNGTNKINMGRQGKRRRGKSKARRGLEGIIIRKGKLEDNLLDGRYGLKADNHDAEEEEVGGLTLRVTKLLDYS
eukprot:XP_016658584.1 PREDICTED: uncharacterized protein LOC107883326 [Acyrthosiphon pisum]